MWCCSEDETEASSPGSLAEQQGSVAHPGHHMEAGGWYQVYLHYIYIISTPYLHYIYSISKLYPHYIYSVYQHHPATASMEPGSVKFESSHHHHGGHTIGGLIGSGY